MKFKIDENLPFIFKRLIEAHGNHQVDSVFHEKLTGINDQKLIQICLEEKRVLLTLDTDFIKVQDPFYGIIIIRSRTQGKNAVKKLFQLFLENFPLDDVIKKRITIEPDLIRIRY